MNDWEFAKAHPFASLFVICIFIVFLFFPLVLLVLLGLAWIYYTFINPEQAEPIKPKYDLPSARTSYKPTSTGQFMSAEDKSAYLQSPKWQALRQQVIARDKCCVVTGRTSNLDVHHITYERLGNELLEDLVLIHRDVHNAIHQKLGYDRTTHFPISAYKD